MTMVPNLLFLILWFYLSSAWGDGLLWFIVAGDVVADRLVGSIVGLMGAGSLAATRY